LLADRVQTMGCAGNAIRKASLFVAALLQGIVAGVILWLIASRLYTVHYTAQGGAAETATCLLDRNTEKNDNFCVIGFVAVGVTFAMMLALSIVQVCCLLTYLFALDTLHADRSLASAPATLYSGMQRRFVHLLIFAIFTFADCCFEWLGTGLAIYIQFLARPR
jgi:hypothetical protein